MPDAGAKRQQQAVASLRHASDCTAARELDSALMLIRPPV
jgi:hypothetical protein